MSVRAAPEEGRWPLHQRVACALARDEADPAARWCCVAEPIDPTGSANRRFRVDQSGAIHFAVATDTPPLAPDPTTDADRLPAGWRRLGR